MVGQVVILGANGRFGRAATRSFSDAGWSVKAHMRQGKLSDIAQVQTVHADVFDGAALAHICKGADIIIHALNPPYDRWRQDLPRLTKSVVAAAQQTGATVLIPGNVYNYGAHMPALLTEDTPHTGKGKGALRAEMERAFRNARNVKTIILRAGDFIEGRHTGNWFDGYITNKLHKGSITYPGPLDRVHTWAYLPDMAQAAVALCEKRHQFKSFEDIGFKGFAITGHQFVIALQDIYQTKFKIGSIPWPVLRLMGLFNPVIREVYAMKYLWFVPHEIDGTAFEKHLPDFKHTPLQTALKQSINALKNA